MCRRATNVYVVYLLLDHTVHCGVRRHGASDLARKIHRIILRATRNIFLRAPCCEIHLLLVLMN